MTADPLWPAPDPCHPVPDLASIGRSVDRFAGGAMEAWERGYLQLHGRRFQDTLRLLPEGNGRRLLDVGAFPGHLSALAAERGWRVTGLNNGVECATSYDAFLGRCAAAGIEVLACEVEDEPFPLPTGSVDAVLLCELFEHLHRNPFHVLAQIFRVLRPGGILILTTPNLRSRESFLRLGHGWGTQPPVSRGFQELMPSILYHRHNREHTAKELLYFLGLQGKDLYDFEPEPVRFSSCYDGGVDVPRIVGRGMRPAVARLERLLRPLTPSLRKQMMVRARRGAATLVEWSSLANVAGFGARREDLLPSRAFTRRFTFPFRPTAAMAGFDLPVPPGSGPLLVSLMACHPEIGGAPPLAMTWRAGGDTLLSGRLDPSPRPVRLRLVVPERAASGATVRLSIETTTWMNPEVGEETGPLLGSAWLLAERLPTAGAVDAAHRRLLAEHLAEEEHPAILHLARPLALLAGSVPAGVAIGPDDHACVGEGWQPLERWGRRWVRWTGPEATAFLAGDAGMGRAHARVMAGDPRLGSVEGTLTARRADGGTASGRFRLPAGGRAVVTSPLPPGSGEVTLTLSVDRPRRPAELIPGSPDTRPLGVAVTRLWLR